MRPASKGSKGRRPPRDATSDYRDKTVHETSRISRLIKERGHPAPLGDPTSRVMLVVEGPVGPRVLEALDLSLRAVGLPEAYVTYASTGLLGEEVLTAEPHALAAVGPGAARDIDGLDHPLAQHPYSEAETGIPFAWTKGTAGLLLPALAPALDDDAAKRRFWKAFLALKTFAPPA